MLPSPLILMCESACDIITIGGFGDAKGAKKNSLVPTEMHLSQYRTFKTKGGGAHSWRHGTETTESWNVASS